MSWGLLAEYLLRVLLAVAVLRQRGLGPSGRLAWLVVGFAFPLIGAPIYLLFGRARLGALRRKRYAAVCRAIGATELRRAAIAPEHAELPPPQYSRLAALVERGGGDPVRGGNRLDLFDGADGFLAALEQDLDAAQHSAHLLFYIWLDDAAGRRIADALVRAVSRGVRCRVLLDGVGSREFLNTGTCAELRACGVELVEALPVRWWRLLLARFDLRNHRKIVVIDGAVGYTGSQNLAEASFALKPKFAPWVDVMIRIVGPGVHDLESLFAQDWVMETDADPEELLTPFAATRPSGSLVQIAGTGPVGPNEAMRELLLTALHSAREEVILTTPYFVPDSPFCHALMATARCGVSTTLVVPARNDSPWVAAASRSYYEGLMEAGVHIYEYEPGLLHAKTLTVDRGLGLITTANMDRRSFDLNFEVSMVVYDSDFSSRLRMLQRSYLGRSRPVDAEAWSRRSPWRRLAENAAGLLTPLL